MFQGDRGPDGEHGIPGPPGNVGQTLMVRSHFVITNFCLFHYPYLKTAVADYFYVWWKYVVLLNQNHKESVSCHNAWLLVSHLEVSNNILGTRIELPFLFPWINLTLYETDNISFMCYTMSYSVYTKVSYNIYVELWSPVCTSLVYHMCAYVPYDILSSPSVWTSLP